MFFPAEHKVIAVVFFPPVVVLQAAQKLKLKFCLTAVDSSHSVFGNHQPLECLIIGSIHVRVSQMARLTEQRFTVKLCTDVRSKIPNYNVAQTW